MSARAGSVRIRGHCTCGASIDASSNPPRVAEDCYAAFRDVHVALGHRMCDAKTAATERRRQRRAETIAP